MTTSRPQRRRLFPLPALALAAAAASIAGVELSRPALAAPEPSPVPKRWELDVQPGALRIAVVNVPEVGPRAYFYLTYKVTNNGTQDLLFAPSFELATDDTSEPLRSGRDVPLAATRAILAKLDNPLMEDQVSIVGTILRGSENAKEGVAIWPIPEMRIHDLAIYGGGFSGENTTVEVPDADGHLDKKVLRKTMMLRYRLPGELTPAAAGEFKAFESRWIMR